MEGLSHLVSESLARYGVSEALDHRRLRWSPWFRCESNFGVMLAPSKPGLFALAEEVIAPSNGKRILGLFQVSETGDLGLALGSLFLPGAPEQARLTASRCFARYAVVEDESQRQEAHRALQAWMKLSAETATGIADETSVPCALGNSQEEVPDRNSELKFGPPEPLPSGF